MTCCHLKISKVTFQVVALRMRVPDPSWESLRSVGAEEVSEEWRAVVASS